MQSLSDFVAALAFSQLTFLSVFFFVRFREVLSRLISLFCICLATYTLSTMSFAADQPIITFILFRFATLAPVFLWFISFVLFVDSGKIHPGVWAAIAFYVLARGIGMGIALINTAVLESTLGFIIIFLIPQVIMLYFSFHTIYLAWAGRRFDLVEQRRRVRTVFVLSMGVLLVAIIGPDFINLSTRLIDADWFINLNPLRNIALSLYIFIICTLFSLAVFRLNEDTLSLIPEPIELKTSPPVNGKSASRTESEIFARINALMEKDQLYSRTGLTIADLASALSMQEYRLRRLINQQLGYRNFNQFLNDYRIGEASGRLENSDASISNIALDVGYASLSVFNKAFKERYGTTPSEFRMQKKSA